LGGARSALAIGVGGFVSFGGMWAARSLGLRTAIHEANVAPGLANRRLSRHVDRVFLGWEQARHALHTDAAVVTGNPVVDPPQAPAPPDGGPTDRRRILVTGGSSGSAFLNREAPELLGRVQQRGPALTVTHQAGQVPLEPIMEGYRRAGIDATVAAYIDDMPAQYGCSDFAITCAGAITLAEMAARGLPCLIVPLSTASEDHQSANARAFADASGLPSVQEQAWRPDELAATLARQIGDDASLDAMRRGAAKVARPDAADRVVQECEQMMAGHW
jgi:UDP-N-acetylglucosamine--N-acetylmuramyl-(pentapeptide) pyrophosphoryl-undecaprenol N-acetylglucosamine transferase